MERRGELLRDGFAARLDGATASAATLEKAMWYDAVDGRTLAFTLRSLLSP